MRDFLKQQIEELELKTGIRQLYWLQQSCENQTEFEKKTRILIDSMMIVCEQFSYIQEEDQRKIILDQMVKDQEYDGLNSRVIFKWLNLHKDHYWSRSHPADIAIFKPASPEEAEKYLKQLMDNLGQIGNPTKVNGMKQIREESGYSKGISQGQRLLFTVGDQCPECRADAELVSGCDICGGSGEVNQVEIHATSLEEARKVFSEYKKRLS